MSYKIDISKSLTQAGNCCTALQNIKKANYWGWDRGMWKKKLGEKWELNDIHHSMNVVNCHLTCAKADNATDLTWFLAVLITFYVMNPEKQAGTIGLAIIMPLISAEIRDKTIAELQKDKYGAVCEWLALFDAGSHAKLAGSFVEYAIIQKKIAKPHKSALLRRYGWTNVCTFLFNYLSNK